MKKGSKKIIKDIEKDEVVIVEKVIETNPNKNNLSNDPLILEISTALFAVEERQEAILKKVNQICIRMGVPKI